MAKELIFAALPEEKKHLVKVIECNVDPKGQFYRQEILAKFGHRTAPAVFLRGKLIGGADKIQELLNAGKLGPMLASL